MGGGGGHRKRESTVEEWVGRNKESMWKGGSSDWTMLRVNGDWGKQNEKKERK